MPHAVIPQSALDQLARLTKHIREAHIRSEAHAEATHDRFNVFTTLLNEGDEVRLHTRFLHCLLDPNGRHDCGSLFLELFFATLDEVPVLNHHDERVRLDLPPSKKPWTVGKEQPRPPHGQIDLLIERAGFGIAMENKINAAEQHLQLASYAAYLKKKHDAAWRLIYLTKDGKKSDTHEGNPYIRISYREHILAWLEKCLRETYHVIPVNQALQQYRKVVRAITGKTLDASAMKPITDFILQNPEILQYRQQISDAITEARAAFLDQLADGISVELRKHGFEAWLRQDLRAGRFGLDDYGDLFLKPTNSAILNPPFVFCIENDSNLYELAVGITTHLFQNRLTAEDLNLFKQMDALLIADAEARDYHKAKGNAIWPTGWHVILRTDDAAIAELTKTPLSVTVTKVCDAVLRHVELVEQVYLDVNRARSTPQ